MRLPVLAILITTSAFSLPSLAAMPDCPLQPDPPAPACQTATHGWAYAADDASAVRAAAALDTAASDFQRHFGRTPPPGAMILSSSFDQEAAWRFSEAHGLGYARVWLDPAAQRAMVEKTLRQAMPDIDEARLEATLDAQEAGTENQLRHELGHWMFTATFWPGDRGSPGERYGTPAPDWLDEAAAILMEAEHSRESREAVFLKALRTTPEHVPTLSEFLASEHPMTAEIRAGLLASGAEQSGSGVQVMASSGPDASRAAGFYGQSIAFANFLIDSSLDAGILGTISAALAGGKTLGEWLESAGPGHGLPASLERLEVEWEAWCESRLAPVPAATGR